MKKIKCHFFLTNHYSPSEARTQRRVQLYPVFIDSKNQFKAELRLEFSMDNHEREPEKTVKRPSQHNSCKYLYRRSLVPSVFAVMFTIALFIRIELVVREIAEEMKMMDLKFSQNLPAVKDSDDHQSSVNKNSYAANGR